MRILREQLRQLVLEELKFLSEAEGDEADEDTEEDAPAEDDTADEPASEETSDETPDEGATDEEKDATKDETAVEVSPAEEAALAKSADDQILAFIIDSESKAIKSATLAQDDKLRLPPEPSSPVQVSVESRWYKRNLTDLLFEETAIPGNLTSMVGSPDIDVQTFSGDIARLVMNYDSLIDMEALIITKAKNYLMDKYNKETADYFIELMDRQHDMRANQASSIEQQNEVPQAPVGVTGVSSAS